MRNGACPRSVLRSPLAAVASSTGIPARAVFSSDGPNGRRRTAPHGAVFSRRRMFAIYGGRSHRGAPPEGCATEPGVSRNCAVLIGIESGGERGGAARIPKRPYLGNERRVLVAQPSGCAPFRRLQETSLPVLAMETRLFARGGILVRGAAKGAQAGVPVLLGAVSGGRRAASWGVNHPGNRAPDGIDPLPGAG